MRPYAPVSTGFSQFNHNGGVLAFYTSKDVCRQSGLFCVKKTAQARSHENKQQGFFYIYYHNDMPMKNAFCHLLFLCLAGVAVAQTSTAYLVLEGERLPPKEITVKQAQNICALQVADDGWQMALKPTTLKATISNSKGRQTQLLCRNGVANAAGAAALEKLKPGDLVFVCELGVPESVKAQVGQFALKVR